MTPSGPAAPRIPYRCPDCGGALGTEDGRGSCRVCGETYDLAGPIPDLVPTETGDDRSAFYEAVFDRVAVLYESPLWYPLGLRLGGGWSIEGLGDWVADGIEPGDAVIDAPTGTGAVARQVAPHADLVHGVDVAEGMLERALHAARREGLAQYALARALVEHLPFGDDRFDVGVCTGALYLVDDPVTALAEIGRVVHSDGRVLATALVEGGPLAVGPIRRAYVGATGVTVASVSAVTGWFEEAGFDRVATERHGALLAIDAERA